MHAHFCLVVLILVLALDSQVYAGRIIGGRKAAPHSRPYMVLVQTWDSKMTCGGFLLNEDFVMTAAHCQDRSYTVLLGLHNFHEQNGVQKVSVEQAFPHKDYNPTEYTHDVMLLKLSSEVKYSEMVKPIPLAGGDDGHLPQSCSVAGWGRNEPNSEHNSPILMEVNVTLIEKEVCKKRMVYCSKVQPGPREGDSGGPLVCEGKAYGVVSAGVREGENGPLLFCTYTKIPDYKSWIDATVKRARKASV
ncbi:granzyme B(G,H)-like [Cheilinus undulatus]|uniref:granzyme B(G,H)-like n=1 Tax=Cheilinus undulatus TaxID=241271 RepID=UPI001BD59B4D|nr:granzyme B(G,H)-like [Cheilinus undulatus]